MRLATRSWCVLVLFFAAGCGEEGGDIGCQHPDRSCFPPFTCLEQTNGGFSCSSEAAGPPSCAGTPPGQHVPFMLEGQLPLHWMTGGGCIEVSYTPALASRASDIAAAVAAWSAFACSQLCFGQPQANEWRPEYIRGERRIHFLTNEEGFSQTENIFEINTGRILSSYVHIAESAIASYPAAGLVRLFGFALGLDSAPPPVGEMLRSVMEPYEEPFEITAPTDEDQEAICALYGTPAYCGD